MLIDIQLTAQPLGLPAGTSQPPVENHTGAWLEFRGVVRGEEAGLPIAALEYEAYRPMAEQTMREIVTQIGALHPCQHVQIAHRLGIVPAGEAAIVVRVGARHRAEAFAMITTFMDRLKQDVPIWKCRALTQEQLAAGSPS